ncbi:MAG: hypothetical protein GY934_22450 [Gammaproteobacteria bacterium]|nr:hypothetical protein [Gammaproteobacteria bacterium]
MVEEQYHCELPLPLFSGNASVGRITHRLAALQAEGERENKVISHPGLSLTNIAYTLQVGREAMEERLALVVSSVEELVERLRRHEQAHHYDQIQTSIKRIYRGNTKTSSPNSELFLGGEAGEAFIRIAINNRELEQLAQLWVSGVEIEWALLYGQHSPRRISLPTYPFERKRYWVGEHPKDRKERIAPLQLQNQRQDQQNGGKLVLKPTHTMALLQVNDQAKNQPAATKMLLETDLVSGDVVRQDNQGQPETIGQETSGPSAFTIRNRVKELLISTLYLEANVDEEKPFNELGMDSITGVEFVKVINQTFSVNMKLGKLYDYPTIRELSTYLSGLIQAADIQYIGGTSAVITKTKAVDEIDKQELRSLLTKLVKEEVTIEQVSEVVETV